MARNTQTKALDMSALQSNLEAAAKNLKQANTAKVKANETADRAEAEYAAAGKALQAGMQQLIAATKVV